MTKNASVFLGSFRQPEQTFPYRPHIAGRELSNCVDFEANIDTGIFAESRNNGCKSLPEISPTSLNPCLI